MLIRKTPLKAKTSLKRRATLRTKSSHKKMKAISDKKKKRKKGYWSIFTNDMGTCIITGSRKDMGAIIDPHHIFGGPDKDASEKYGFMLPLRRDWHETANYSIHQDIALAISYKLKCQEYWINVLHKTKDEFRNEFRMWYEERDKIA